MMRHLFTALVLVALTASCGDDERAEIVVFAASSLADAFADLEAEFEARHPEHDVTLNLGGSSALREQILSGAPADVFAAANEATMGQVVAGGANEDEPRVFARNRLQIVVPKGNPGGVSDITDLADDELFTGVCAPAVPCGALASEALSELALAISVDTEEPNARALLAKVVAGELDAGLVYVTDVLAAGDDAEGIPLPPDVDASASYPIVTLEGAGAAAETFVEFVLSPDGAEILRSHGFGAP